MQVKHELANAHLVLYVSRNMVKYTEFRKEMYLLVNAMEPNISAELVYIFFSSGLGLLSLQGCVGLTILR